METELTFAESCWLSVSFKDVYLSIAGQLSAAQLLAF